MLMLLLVTVLISALLYTPGNTVTGCLKNKVLDCWYPQFFFQWACY